MFENFPVKVVDPLPRKIEPCPIAEAAFEIRFTTSTPWAELPGKVAGLLHERYTERQELQLFHWPPEIKQQIAGSVHIPQYRFASDQFVINLAPQMIGLCARSMRYPGWPAIEAELRTFLDQIVNDGFMDEGARLGIRYTDFFELNIFDHIDLDVSIQGQGKPIRDNDRQLITVFNEGPMTIRLALINGAILENEHGPRRGSILDIDVAFGPLDFDLKTNVLDRFTEAHLVIKKLFFGLIKKELLATLNPQYP